jgi:spermidine synthase
LIAPLFLVSGGTALLYQVAFGKKLGTIFGATAYAVSAVLAAFMGGLALGSYLGGRYGQRVRRPLFVYGVAELLVGAVCALTPNLFDAIGTGYVAAVSALPSSLWAVSALRLLLTALVVVVPTVAMGVTLPMLARVVAGHTEEGNERDAARRRLAWLYGINTAGGAIGALAAGYLVLPELGVRGTMRGAALVNAAIALVAMVAGRREHVSAAEAASTTRARALRDEPVALGERRLFDVLAFASGLLVFATEVVDTHLLALLIGNSAYAFGLMLATFLTCLSLAAALAGPLERRAGAAALPLGLFAAAAAIVVTLPVWGKIPIIFLGMAPHATSWGSRELVRALAATLALFVPTTAMGLTFPLLLRRVAGRGDVAQLVGRMTAINTLGSITGSLVCGYAILPALGSEWTLRVVALAFALAGAVTLWRRQATSEASRGRPLFALAGAAAVALAGWFMPRWDMIDMTNGANVYFEARPRPTELVFVKEDVHGGLTSVTREGRMLILYTNGKFQGDNTFQMTAQRSMAHFPSLFVPRYEHALVIGLGTGVTLGTVASYPYQTIDVSEISPAIVEASKLHFSEVTGHVFDDPRVRLMVDDGRNALMFARERYDLITIELSSVWFAGAANLYSHEFYQLCRSRLQPDGILQQWVQLHHIHRRELAVALNTLRQEFEHVALFYSGGQGVVVAANRPLVASRARLAELSDRPSIRHTLGDAATLEELMERLLVSGADLDRFIAENTAGAETLVSTDDNMYLEYATPKGNVLDYTASLKDTVTLIASYNQNGAAERHLAP